MGASLRVSRDPVEARQKWQDSTQLQRNLKNHLEQNQRCIRETALTVWHVGLIMWGKQGLCPTSPLALLFSQHGEADSLAAATSEYSRANVEKWLASKEILYCCRKWNSSRRVYISAAFMQQPAPWIKSCMHIFLIGMSLFLPQQNTCFPSGTKCAECLDLSAETISSDEIVDCSTEGAREKQRWEQGRNPD